ncbi:unnamed protein product [Rotaria socialis]|uniref:Glyoxalase domain-containing protein 4 n=1 Tax=Rotaria socialis TaxID=392032 RepID=A0A820X503_9BILA|nr:unnamed protein product [Rotaria socialis]
MSSGSSLQESTSDNRRLLHFTMKITDRLAVRHFFCDILGMKILRHEEMDFACAAQCNGDFVSPWSKTMVGYGNENSVFVFELNYNYDVEGYEYGNDFSSVTIRNRQAVGNARQLLDKKFIETDNSQSIIVRSPDGHRFILINDDVSPGGNPVQCLSLNICFVGEENYFKACETDPDAENKFYKGLENKPDDPNKYVIGEDESTKQHDKQ